MNELYTLEGWILWHVKQTSMKLSIKKQFKKKKRYTIGVQSEPPQEQDVPRWYAAYCEPRTILASGSRETSPLL